MYVGNFETSLIASREFGPYTAWCHRYKGLVIKVMGAWWSIFGLAHRVQLLVVLFERLKWVVIQHSSCLISAMNLEIRSILWWVEVLHDDLTTSKYIWKLQKLGWRYRSAKPAENVSTYLSATAPYKIENTHPFQPPLNPKYFFTVVLRLFICGLLAMGQQSILLSVMVCKNTQK